MAKLQHKWWYEKTDCKSDKDNPLVMRNELSLTNLAGVFYILIGGLLVALAISLVEFCFRSQKPPTTTSLTSNTMQMTDTMKPKSRLPITSARDYDNGQVNGGFKIHWPLAKLSECNLFPFPFLCSSDVVIMITQYYPQSPSMDHPEAHHINAHQQT